MNSAVVEKEKTTKEEKLGRRNKTSLAAQVVERFLDLNVQFNPLGEIPQKDLYIEYEIFCQKHNLEKVKTRAFGQKVLSYVENKHPHHVTRKTTQVGQVFRGIEFRAPTSTNIRDEICEKLFVNNQICEDPEIKTSLIGLYELLERKNV
jgi:hypothetical protein